MGTFTFAMRADIPSSDYWNGDLLESGFLSGAETGHTIDCLAESGKVWGQLYSPSRKSTHIITPFGTLSIGVIMLFSAIKTAKPAGMPNRKNTLLLKLRI